MGEKGKMKVVNGCWKCNLSERRYAEQYDVGTLYFCVIHGYWTVHAKLIENTTFKVYESVNIGEVNV